MVLKPSDQHTFIKKDYANEEKKAFLLALANKNCEDFHKFTNIDGQRQVKGSQSVLLPQGLLFQIIGAFEKGAYFAYHKKPSLLKTTSKSYKKFSTEISNFFTTDSMVKLILLYKKFQYDQYTNTETNTGIKQAPPFYLLDFIGYYLNKKKINKQDFLKQVSIGELEILCTHFKVILPQYSREYQKTYSRAYQKKQDKTYSEEEMYKIEIDILNKIYKSKKDINILDDVLNSYFKLIEGIDKKKYNELLNMFKKYNKDIQQLCVQKANKDIQQLWVRDI